MSKDTELKKMHHGYKEFSSMEVPIKTNFLKRNLTFMKHFLCVIYFIYIVSTGLKNAPLK